MPSVKIRRSATGLLAEQDLLVGEDVVGEYDRRLRRVDAELHLEFVRVARVGILLQRRPADRQPQRLVDDLIAGAQAVVLTGTGHLGTVTRPQEFAILMRNFVGSAAEAEGCSRPTRPPNRSCEGRHDAA